MTTAYPPTLPLIMAMVLSLFSTVLTAQVYQTVDENGNTVFSDTPSSGANEVEIQTPNTADSVEVRPQQPSQPKQAKPASNAATPTPSTQTERVDPYLINSDEDNRRRRIEPKQRPENRPEHPSNQPARVNRPANRR